MTPASYGALALLVLLPVGGCGDKSMTLNKAAVAKESSLEVRIGGAGEGGQTSVGLQAMLMPGVALMAVSTHTSGVTSTKPERPVDAAVVQASWAPLLQDSPANLPEGEGFSLVARVGGKTALHLQTTLAAARADATLAQVVEGLLAIAAGTHGEQAALAKAAWQPTP